MRYNSGVAVGNGRCETFLVTLCDQWSGMVANQSKRKQKDNNRKLLRNLSNIIIPEI